MSGYCYKPGLKRLGCCVYLTPPSHRPAIIRDRPRMYGDQNLIKIAVKRHQTPSNAIPSSHRPAIIQLLGVARAIARRAYHDYGVARATPRRSHYNVRRLPDVISRSYHASATTIAFSLRLSRCYYAPSTFARRLHGDLRGPIKGVDFFSTLYF